MYKPNIHYIHTLMRSTRFAIISICWRQFLRSLCLVYSRHAVFGRQSNNRHMTFTRELALNRQAPWNIAIVMKQYKAFIYQTESTFARQRHLEHTINTFITARALSAVNGNMMVSSTTQQQMTFLGQRSWGQWKILYWADLVAKTISLQVMIVIRISRLK